MTHLVPLITTKTDMFCTGENRRWCGGDCRWDGIAEQCAPHSRRNWSVDGRRPKKEIIVQVVDTDRPLNSGFRHPWKYCFVFKALKVLEFGENWKVLEMSITLLLPRFCICICKLKSWDKIEFCWRNLQLEAEIKGIVVIDLNSSLWSWKLLSLSLDPVSKSLWELLLYNSLSETQNVARTLDEYYLSINWPMRCCFSTP